MKNKHAQEDSTLVWIFAVFVILFILVVYIGVAFSMSIEKSFSWESGAKENEILYTGDIALSQNLFSILNSEIVFNDKREKAITAIMDAYDLYFENPKDLNKIETSNNNLARELKKVMDKYCINYKLGIPQGMITEKGKLEPADVLGNKIYWTIGEPAPSEWTMIVQFPVTYRGMPILFQFTELKFCSPYQKISSTEKT